MRQVAIERVVPPGGGFVLGLLAVAPFWAVVFLAAGCVSLDRYDDGVARAYAAGVELGKAQVAPARGGIDIYPKDGCTSDGCNTTCCKNGTCGTTLVHCGPFPAFEPGALTPAGGAR